MTLLTVKNLTVRALYTPKVLVQDIGFKVKADTCLGIVGESGSGKTVACKAMLGLASPWLATKGEVLFDGTNLLAAPTETLRKIRGSRICMILQDPMTAFDPICTLGGQMVEILCQKSCLGKREARLVVLDAMTGMQIENPCFVFKKHPHQLSGGMLQRCMIALTLALEPDLIIADEPTTALDVINQEKVINSFIQLRQTTGTAMIFVSHDWGVIRHLAQDLLVMQKGRQVEYGPARQIFDAPCHPYTQYLIETRRALSRSFSRAMALIGDETIPQEKAAC